MEIAGVPKAVHGAFILASPVAARPNGAGPVAPGTKITGVALYISATRALQSAIYRLASSYRSTEIWRPSRTNGKQGLKEAQRFPRDYDGIIAGAPANFWTHLMAGDLWIAQATLKDPASYIPKEKYPLIHKAVLDACDALDGVKDGVL